MKRLTLVILSLLLAAALASCAIPLINQSSQASGEATPAKTIDEKTGFLDALKISLEQYLRGGGDFGMESFEYGRRFYNREIDLFFADRMYTLSFSGDLTTGEGSWHVLRHTSGQYWYTGSDVGGSTSELDVKLLYTVAERKDVLLQQDRLILREFNLGSAFFYNYFLLQTYDRYIQGNAEKADYNGVSCWRYTAIKESNDSKTRTEIYFRQDDGRLIYAQSDIVSPDGTITPGMKMQTLSKNEAEDFYREKKELFQEVDDRDIHGENTLTIVIDPDKAGEITYRCPVRRGEILMFYYPDRSYALYLDRAGTQKAEYRNIPNQGEDVTLYAIKKEAEPDETSPAPQTPETIPAESLPTQAAEADPPTTKDLWTDNYTGLPLLERNDLDSISDTELCSAINSGCLTVIAPWVNEGAIDYSPEAIVNAGAAVYSWAQKVKDSGIIDDCTLCEESGTVAFFLKSGGINLFSLPIRDTYSGDQYVAVGIEGLSWIEDAVITGVDQFSRFRITGSHEAAEYIEKNNGNYNHQNIKAGELTIDSLISFLESIPEKHIRVIFWRSHGDLFEGLDRKEHFALAFQEKETEEKEKRYEVDIAEKRILHCGNHYAISDGFFDKYLPDVEGGLFCCGACDAGADGGKTAQVFFKKGFDCYIGPTGKVWTTYSDKMLGQIAVHLCEKENGMLLTALEALKRAQEDVGEHDIYGTYFAIGENPETEPFRLIPSTTGDAPPAFTEENIKPYLKMVADLAYAVLQRGTGHDLFGSAELSQHEALNRFKLDMDNALFAYTYLNEALLLEPLFSGRFDAENSIRYCQTNQDEISRTLKALLDLEISKGDFPDVYDRRNSSLCIWDEKGLFLCVPMMGEAPAAKWKDLVFKEGKALLYAEVFEPFNDVPTDQLVITLIPAKNELGFTIESISLNPKAAADSDSLNIMDYWGRFAELCEKAGIAGTSKDADTFMADPLSNRRVTLSTGREGKCLRIQVGVDLVEADGAKADSPRSDFEPKLLANGWELMGERQTKDEAWASWGWDPEKLLLVYEKKDGDAWYQMQVVCYMTEKGPAIWTITIYDHAETLRG